MEGSIQKYIREIILPIMIEKGFEYSSDEYGDGIFRKKCEDGVRSQQVIIQLKSEVEPTIDFDRNLWSEHLVNSPLTLIFQAVLNGRLENVCSLIEADLKYIGNI